MGKVRILDMATFLTKGVDDAKIKEGYVKDRVKRFLDSIGAWQFWPVQTGTGAQGIPDCIFCWRGIFCSIETKRPGRRGHQDRGCSKLQTLQGALIQQAGGGWFVVDGPADLEEVRQYLNECLRGHIDESEIVKLCTGYWATYLAEE